MLNKILKKKFLTSITVIFILVIIYIVSNNSVDFKQELAYVNDDTPLNNIYLNPLRNMDNNFLWRRLYTIDFHLHFL